MKSWFYISFLFITTLTFGQKAVMSFHDSEMRIGEQTKFELRLEYTDPDGDAQIAWPQFDKMLTDNIEIIDRTVDYDEMIDSTQGIHVRKQEFTITCFKPGLHKLQPIGIELNDTMYYSNATNLMINTVEVDTAKGITDIKENYPVDYSFGEKMEDWFRTYWPFLAGVAGLVAVFFLVLLIRRKRPEKIEPEAPPIPAHITALKSLIELKKRQAWKTENKKEYYSELTYTVRLYLEERFGIQAIEHTTREIINDLKYADISEEDKVYLRKILSEADMVKFAKMTPQEKHGEESLDKSIDFVQKTKVAEDNAEELSENED